MNTHPTTKLVNQDQPMTLFGEKMMQEGEVQKIDTSSMEYYKNIDKKYLDFCKVFDPTNEYAVPYLWGTVGILYNTKVVKEKVDSWLSV